MRDILVTLLVFGSIPVILIKPHVGVLMWSWISYMNPHRLTWGFAYDMRFALMIGIATLIAWLISREPKRLPWHPITALLLVFTAWVSVTTIFAQFPDHAYDKWDRVIKVLVFNGVVTLGLMRTRQRLNALIWVIVLSVGFFSIKGGIATIIGGGKFTIYGPPNSQFSSNNYFALITIMTIPFMFYLGLSTNIFWIRIVMLASIFLSVFSVLGTGSRGGLVGLFILLVLFVAMLRKRVLVSVIVASALAVGFSLMPDHWHARMSTIVEYEQDPSVQGRFAAWEFALETAAKSPILGGGFQVFRANKDEASPEHRNAHSIYFEVLGEHGYVGLALFLLIGISAFIAIGSVVRRSHGRNELKWAQDLARMCRISLIAYAIVGSVSNVSFLDLFYHIVVIIILADNISRQKVGRYDEIATGAVRPSHLISHEISAK